MVKPDFPRRRPGEIERSIPFSGTNLSPEQARNLHRAIDAAEQRLRQLRRKILRNLLLGVLLGGATAFLFAKLFL